uniref:DUF4283 domain-containing protein n=1 Tax=Populus trichocarpa TaxID=3694 RepID=A0A2K2C7J2_POPTR
MVARLKQSWRLSVGFDLLDVGHGFFMVKFDHEYPRMIFVHYLTVRLWICIEVDLDKPVVGKVWIQDLWYKVEYEGLHTIYLQFMWVLVNGGSSPATALLWPVTAQSQTSQVLMLILKIKPHKLYYLKCMENGLLSNGTGRSEIKG